MSDDERIARLIELARRVWPDAAKGGIAYDADNNFKPGEVTLAAHQPEWTPLVTLYCNHPRALDALEKALLVLAGEPPAWVEQLCKQWEREAMEPPPETVRTAHPPYLLRIALQECAKELRERAAKESR